MRIGIDLGGTKIEGVVLGDDLTITKKLRVPTPQGDYQATLKALHKLVSDLEQAVGKGPLPVGLGIPGAASNETGLVKNANSVCLIGMPLEKDLSQLLSRPIKLENDANCFVISEATDGAAKNGKVVFGAILGTGVGGGICINQKALQGVNKIAGEWGHNPLPWPLETELPGPKCYCGKVGCIESFLSGPAIEKQYFQKTQIKLTAIQIHDKLKAGDSAAHELMVLYVDRLARSLATIINVLDPDMIVLGGGISNIDLLYTEVPKVWGKYIFSNEIFTKLVKNVHGDSSGVRGAAWLNPIN